MSVEILDVDFTFVHVVKIEPLCVGRLNEHGYYKGRFDFFVI